MKSRKSSHIRRKKRKMRLLNEISDLQIQLLDLEKLVSNEGERILSEIDKGTRDNKNLVKWLKIYDDQIESYQKEIYNLNLKLYFSSSSQQQPQQPQPQSQQPQPQPRSQSLPQQPQPQPPPQPQPQQAQQQQLQQQPQSQPQPQFKSLAEYFNHFKNQDIF